MLLPLHLSFVFSLFDHASSVGGVGGGGIRELNSASARSQLLLLLSMLVDIVGMPARHQSYANMIRLLLRRMDSRHHLQDA